MNRFSLCLDALCLTAQSALHIAFVGRLTGKRQKTSYFILYFSLLCIMEGLSVKLALPGIPAVGAELLILYGMSRCAFGNRRAVSWAASIFAVYISQLSFGVVNSAEAVVFPRLVGAPLLYPLLALATLLAFAVCACCYIAVLKFLSLREDGVTPYVGLLLFPGLFFFAAELYILHTSYSALPPVPRPEDFGKHVILLLVQALGLAALLCTLYAYERLCRGLQAQNALQSLTQAAQAQKTYIAEARARYDRSKAFRHDIKNHLSVLSGLLSSGNLDEGRAYLQKLDKVSESLSFPYHTGNPVVDILLGEKLGLAKAKGITAEVTLLLPNPCGIDDLDLCVIFANALDNAIHACGLAGGAASIRISGERQGDFYMLAFENTCSGEALPPMGTGLSNINSVAGKYHGAMAAEKTDRRFSLHVLLNISLQPESISFRKP